MYPGIKGRIQGDKKLISPPANAISKFKITYSLYLIASIIEKFDVGK